MHSQFKAGMKRRRTRAKRRNKSKHRTLRTKRGGGNRVGVQFIKPAIPIYVNNPNATGSFAPINNFITRAFTYGNPISVELSKGDHVSVLQPDGSIKIGQIMACTEATTTQPPLCSAQYYDKTGNLTGPIENNVTYGRIDVLSKTKIYEEFIRSLMYANAIMENKLYDILSFDPTGVDEANNATPDQDTARTKKGKKPKTSVFHSFFLDVNSAVPPHKAITSSSV